MTVIFLDFEASSLMRGSFPIEVGWALPNGDVEAHLIVPAVGWTEWSPKSEAIHGLSLDYLIREGRPVAEVAARVLEVFSAPDAIVASDNPRWEQMWLNRLMRVADRADHGIHVQDAARIYVGEGRRLLTLAPAKEDVGYRYVADRLLDESVAIAADCQHAEAKRHRVRHRAGPDAEGMRWIFDEIRRRADARLGLG